MLTILYQDDHLIAIEKPTNLLVHKTELDKHETRFAVQLLRDQIGKRVYPVHRLDKGTSGVLLFALDKESARQAGWAFEQQQVDKSYLAIVRGYPEPTGQIDHPLTRRIADLEWLGKKVDPAPQLASTGYERLGTVELPFASSRYPCSRFALMALYPQTGRRHQLRRHMKHISHPIIGDATYGKGEINRQFAQHIGHTRLWLACVSMQLQHPVTGDVLRLQSPLAEEFHHVLEQLGWQAEYEAWHPRQLS